jgi:hypothetical protein
MDYNSDLLSGPTAPQPAEEAKPAADSGYGSDLLSGWAPGKNGTDESVPDWHQIPGRAVSNFPSDAVEVAGNIGHAIMHPIDTAANIGKVGLGYIDKGGQALGLPKGEDNYEQYADAMNKMVMDNYGSIDNFKKTLADHPAQALMDISAVFTGGGSLGAKLPGVAGKVGEAVAATGRTIDPLTAVTKPVMGAINGTSALMKHGLGHRTNVGPEAVGAAYEAGLKGGEPAAAFKENLRGKAQMEEPVMDAMKAMENIVSDKNSAYQSGIAQAGLNQPINASSLRRIAKGMQEAGDIGHQKGFVTDPAAMKVNADMNELVGHFIYERPDFHTVQGLDALKQAIGSYTSNNNLSGKSAVVANTYYHSVLDAIKQQAPKYAQVMEDYSEAKGLITQIQKSFSLPANERKLVVDTSLRKLQSVLRNNASTNYGYRKTLLEHLEENGAPNIRYKLAGQALNTTEPRGISKVAAEKGAEIAGAMIGVFTGHPELALGALKAGAISVGTSTPRLVGEGAYYAGRVAKPLSKIFNRPNARVLNQLGKPYTGENLGPLQGQARGGAVERALRLTKKGRD